MFAAALNPVEATSPSSSWWCLQPLSGSRHRKPCSSSFPLWPHRISKLSPSPPPPPHQHPGSCKTLASVGKKGGEADSGSQEWRWSGEEAPPGHSLKERKEERWKRPDLVRKRDAFNYSQFLNHLCITDAFPHLKNLELPLARHMTSCYPKGVSQAFES